MAVIRIEGPDGLDIQCPLTDEEVTIGSAEDCVIRIDRPDVDPHHASISVHAVLRDTSDSQGVFFHGMQIPQHVFLPGDRVSLGSAGAIQLSMEGTAPQPTDGGETAEAASADAYDQKIAELHARLEAASDKSRATTAWQELQAESQARELALQASLRESEREIDQLRATQKDRGVSDRMLAAIQEEKTAEEELSRDRLAEIRVEVEERDHTIEQLRGQLLAASEGELVKKNEELEAEHDRLRTGREEETVVLRRRIDQLRGQADEREQEIDFLKGSVETLEQEMFSLRTEFAGVRVGLLWPVATTTQTVDPQEDKRLLELMVRFAENIERSSTKIYNSLHTSQAELPTEFATVLATAKEQGTTAARRNLDQHLKMLTGRWAHAWGLIFRQGYRNWAGIFLKELSPNKIQERVDISWVDKSLGGQEKKLWEAYTSWAEDLTENVLVDQIDNEIKLVQGFFKL